MPSLLEKFESLSREEQDRVIVTRIKQGRSKKELCLLFAIPPSRITEALASVKTRQDKTKIKEANKEEGPTQPEALRPFDFFADTGLTPYWLGALFFSVLAFTIGVIAWEMHDNATIALVSLGVLVVIAILPSGCNYFSEYARYNRKVAKNFSKAKRKQQQEIAKQRRKEQQASDYQQQLLHKIDSTGKPPKANQTAGWIALGIFIVFVASLLFYAVGTNQNLARPIYPYAVLSILLLLVLPIYFLPTIVANRKKKKQETAIAVLNLLLGWTFLGWVVALVWACMDD
jgi:hypothetical protein